MNNWYKFKVLIGMALLFLSAALIESARASTDKGQHRDLLLVYQQEYKLGLEGVDCVVTEKLYKEAIPPAMGRPQQMWRVIDGHCVEMVPIEENEWAL